jgi:hypothetical protein
MIKIRLNQCCYGSNRQGKLTEILGIVKAVQAQSILVRRFRISCRRSLIKNRGNYLQYRFDWIRLLGARGSVPSSQGGRFLCLRSFYPVDSDSQCGGVSI